MTQTSQNGTGQVAPAPSEQIIPGGDPNLTAFGDQQKLQEYASKPRQPRQPKQQQPVNVIDKKGTEEEENNIQPDYNTIGNAFSKISVTSGLAIAFVVLIIAIWMLIPTQSGYTRMELLWFTIIGKTKLTTSSDFKEPGQPVPTVPGSEPVPTTPPVPKPLNQQLNQNGSGPSMENVDFAALDWAGM